MRRRLALSQHDLHARLARIDVEGWDGPTASELLGYVRENLVRIQVSTTGLTGPAAEQAEATGWETAWELLTCPEIRTAGWPWSLLWVSVRRAVRGEWAAGAYLTNARTAWELREDAEPAAWEQVPLSLERLVAAGFAPATLPGGRTQPLLAGVVETLIGVGWEPELAARLVLRLADAARPGAGGLVMGWRWIAAEFGLPAWQVRRVMLALHAAAIQPRDADVEDHEEEVGVDLVALCAATTRHRGKPTGRERIAS